MNNSRINISRNDPFEIFDNYSLGSRHLLGINPFESNFRYIKFSYSREWTSFAIIQWQNFLRLFFCSRITFNSMLYKIQLLSTSLAIIQWQNF